MINSLFKGREARTVRVKGGRYIVLPVLDISCRSALFRSPRDISQVPAEGFVILEDDSREGKAYIHLSRLGTKILPVNMNMVPSECRYPHPQTIVGVDNVLRDPSIYVDGEDMRELSVHCEGWPGFERVQTQIYVERLLKIQRKA